MSISKPRTGESNPATKFIEYKGSTGKFQYYDKAQEKNIEVPMPIEFVVCDELATIKGWSDKHQSGIYSNEVHDTTQEEMTVKYFKGGEIVRGLYSDIRGDIVGAGGRYVKSVYAVLGGELVNFQFKGAALSAWIEKDNNKNKEVTFTQPKFVVKETKEEKKGATVYQVPVFESVQSTQEEWDEAVKIDSEILQPYFESKETKKEMTEEDVAKAGTDDAKQEVAEEVKEEVKIDDFPWEEPQQ